MNVHPEISQRTEPVLWITGSTKPGPYEKRTCIDLVTRLAQDGWSITTDQSSPIGTLAEQSTRATGGQFVPFPTAHRMSKLVEPHTLRVALPRLVWDARTAGLCTIAATKARGRLIIRVDLTPTDTILDARSHTIRSHVVGIER
jgi:hypothetical protein